MVALNQGLIQKYNSTDPSNINVFRYGVQSAAVPLRLSQCSGIGRFAISLVQSAVRTDTGKEILSVWVS